MQTKSNQSKAAQNNPSQPEEYDLLVLGSGAAGKLLSWTLAPTGMRTAVIERKYIGGACPNIACLPSKNVIQSAKVASYFFRGREFGISKDNCRIDMAAVRERKRKMVRELVEAHLDNYKTSGAELILASGRFIGDRTIEATQADGKRRILRGKHVIINTGTSAAIESIPGLAESKPMTHIEALELDHIPEHLLIVGGGYVGLEFAQAMRRFGSRVTVIERNSRLIHREDPDVSEGVEQLFRDEGIDIFTNFLITKVEGKSGQSVKAYLKRNGSDVIVEATHILVASGRTPNTKDLGLDSTGVEVDGRGYVKVNERLETTTPGIWAAGDCAGSPHFTHISENDFHVIHDNMLGGHRTTVGRQVPFCMFTDPELARVGLSETEAKARGVQYRVAKIPMSAIFRAKTLSETRGFLKVLIEAEGDQILGFTGFGWDAGEMMAAVQVAMIGKMPYTTLRDVIFTHPTMAEGLISLLAKVPAIGKPNK